MKVPAHVYVAIALLAVGELAIGLLDAWMFWPW